MAPNKRGGPPTTGAQSVITATEVAARGSGTNEDRDTYDDAPFLASECRVFFTGLMFLTRLPCPRWCDHHPAFLMRSMAYFPLFGVLVGAWGAVFFQAACVLWPPAIAAGASTLATVWLTGCFHEDGLADCFDGFGGGWGRPQILRIMKDSRVGTYALVGMALALHTKMWALASMQPWDAAAAMVAAHCASRWTSVPLLRACTYLQDEEDAKKGLYNWFAASQRLVTWPRVLLSTGAALAVPYLALGLQRAALVWVTTVVVTAAAGYYGTAILGGVVGDYLGATIQVAEVCAYLALSADWGALAAGWRPILVLCGTVLLPVIYTRRIVDFGVAAC